MPPTESHFDRYELEGLLHALCEQRVQEGGCGKWVAVGAEVVRSQCVYRYQQHPLDAARRRARGRGRGVGRRACREVCRGVFRTVCAPASDRPKKDARPGSALDRAATRVGSHTQVNLQRM